MYTAKNKPILHLVLIMSSWVNAGRVGLMTGLVKILTDMHTINTPRAAFCVRGSSAGKSITAAVNSKILTDRHPKYVLKCMPPILVRTGNRVTAVKINSGTLLNIIKKNSKISILLNSAPTRCNPQYIAFCSLSGSF